MTEPSERQLPRRYDASQGSRIIGPQDGMAVDLGAVGVRFMVWVEESGGGFSRGDVWRALPMEQVLKAPWWRLPALPAPLRPPYGGRHRTISDRACLAAIGRRAEERAGQQMWWAKAEMWTSRLR